ncbi:MAG: 1-deoxy-D-xylulose-5-phosphate synthase [Chloroflexota bacterium]|nr:1-deoxy-D-xylulose-5-phosphate synthase [Chloroflexota bacterium]
MVKLLDCIDEPTDLKRLTLAELEQLAVEIRQEIIATVTANGGHLASNLGVVELTIALHRSFDSPRDKIIWDVGHQTYAHKLLTGRRDDFATIRTHGGISGFAEPGESPHDHFGTGHASTSVSAAVGMATARDMSGEGYNVVAVIGDAALAGGMAFEAVNHAGHLGTRMIVVLNDNGMAISPSVGALARVIYRLRLDRRYHRAKKETSHILARLPAGNRAWQLWKRVEKGLKGFIIPAMFWEELGFTYVGPIDGHSIADMAAVLSQVKKHPNGPTLVHVVTRKGKGHRPAETDAAGFHGVSPSRSHSHHPPSYSEVFGRTLLRLARENPRIVAVTAAMPEGTGLSIMAQELPGRVFDVGICEQHAVTFAAGLATQGYIPVVAIYSTFLQRAVDQVIHDVCLQNLPVVLAIDRGGIVGEDGKTHQGTFDLSYLGFVPNMVLACPKDENELQHLLFTALEARCPFALRYPRGHGLGVPIDESLQELPLGKAEVLRNGDDLAVAAVGAAVGPAMDAAERLSRDGVECTVVNARFVKPVDRDLILEVANRTGRVVTVEENALRGGFGSAVLEAIQDAHLPEVRVERIGLPDIFVEHGSQEALRAKYGLDAEGIVKRVLQSFPVFTPPAEARTGIRHGSRGLSE